jgi:hypothetical protein
MGMVNFSFTAVTIENTNCTIKITYGEVQLEHHVQLSIFGAVPFNNFTMNSNSVNFNVADGAQFSTQVNIPILATGQPENDPVVNVTNFNGGQVSVTWPDTDGQGFGTLTASTDFTLTHFVSS